METKVAPKDRTRITIREEVISNISSGALMAAMEPAVARVATSISRWASKISRSTQVSDRANIKCQCQDNLKKALATKRWTHQSSQLLDNLEADLTRKWFIKLKSPNQTKWIIVVEGLRQLTWGSQMHQKNRKACSNSSLSNRNSSKCPCSPSSRTQYR